MTSDLIPVLFPERPEHSLLFVLIKRRVVGDRLVRPRRNPCSQISLLLKVTQYLRYFCSVVRVAKVPTEFTLEGAVNRQFCHKWQGPRTCEIPGLNRTTPITARSAASHRSIIFIPRMSIHLRGKTLLTGSTDVATVHSDKNIECTSFGGVYSAQNRAGVSMSAMVRMTPKRTSSGAMIFACFFLRVSMGIQEGASYKHTLKVLFVRPSAPASFAV